MFRLLNENVEAIEGIISIEFYENCCFFFFFLWSFDNSDYQRNGDYFPTRLNVQKDGINLIGMTKIRSNPENNVGLLTYAR